MFDVRHEFSGIKTRIFGLIAAFSLQTPASEQDTSFENISSEARTLISVNIVTNQLELRNFSFSLPDSIKNLIEEQKIAESSFWVKLQNAIESNRAIKNPDNLIRSFESLFESEIFRPECCSKLEYANYLVDQILDPEKNIYQGKRATCGATNIQYAMARFNPELYVDFAVSSVISDKNSFSLENDITDYLLSPDFFKADNSRRNAVSRVVQASLMEALNGESLSYNNTLGFHYSKSGKSGKGVEMESARDLLSKLFQRQFVISAANSDKLDLDKLSNLAQVQPVVVSLKWRKLSEEEIQQRIEQTGAAREKYVDDQGYLGHMLTLYGTNGDQVILKSTWSPYMHSKYENSQTLGPQTTPVGRYDKEKALIFMDKAEFLSRLKKVIY